MKRIVTLTANALSTTLFVSTTGADTVDATNPDVTNPRVNLDGESRYDNCKQFQPSTPTNATEDQLDAFDIQCAEFGTATGQLSLPQNATEQQIKQ